MKSMKSSATTAELIQLLRQPDLDLTDQDLLVLADHLEELSKSPTPKTEKARRRKMSRSDRFSEAQGKVSDAKSKMEELRDELQNWRDSLPENLQSSQKADDLDTAISELDDAINNLESVESSDVNFPGMFG